MHWVEVNPKLDSCSYTCSLSASPDRDPTMIIIRTHTQEPTDHLNTMDSTGNLKFTHKEGTSGTIDFLDIKIHHGDDGSIKNHRKPAHTDQYPLWTLEHPTAHKISVVRILYERASIITEEEHRLEEEKQRALTLCQYPKWAINKEKQVKRKENELNFRTKTKNRTKKCNVIYKEPCRSCEKTYIGETGRTFNTRRKEHKKKNTKKETTERLTRTIKEKAKQENSKLAISDH